MLCLSIERNDYVQGFELMGPNFNVRKMAGWVDTIQQHGDHILYTIQADDSWGGARSTVISTEYGSVTKLEPKQRPSATRYY